MTICVLLSFFAKKQHLCVEKEVSLHWFESCQVLHLVVTLLVVSPHVEGTLHQQLTKLTYVPLAGKEKREQTLCPNLVNHRHRALIWAEAFAQASLLSEGRHVTSASPPTHILLNLCVIFLCLTHCFPCP